MTKVIVRYLRGQWDRVAAWAAFGLAVLALLGGWLGISNTPWTAEQIPYILSAGVGSVILSVIGATLWLSADLKDEWRQLDDLRADLQAFRDYPAVDLAASVAHRPEAGPTQTGGLVTADSA